jgi:hypothetical protein
MREAIEHELDLSAEQGRIGAGGVVRDELEFRSSDGPEPFTEQVQPDSAPRRPCRPLRQAQLVY